MIKILRTDGVELGIFYLRKYGIPPIGSILIKDEISYTITSVIFNEDEDVILIHVTPSTNTFEGLSAAQVLASLPSETKNEILGYIAEGKPLSAVKCLKEETGLGLKESKDIIDTLKKSILK